MSNTVVTINHRIELLLAELHISSSGFAKALGVFPSVIGNITGGRLSKPGFELLEKIVMTYPQIRAEWLLRGQGTILKTSDAADADCREELRQVRAKHQDLEQDYERLEARYNRLARLSE